MKYSLKEKKDKTENPLSVITASFLKEWQTKWAVCIQEKTAGFSKKTWLIILSGFILLSTIYNVLVLSNSVTRGDLQNFSLTRISRPTHVDETGDARAKAKIGIALQNRQKFKSKQHRDSVEKQGSPKPKKNR